jgi:hypothetical protein
LSITDIHKLLNLAPGNKENHELDEYKSNLYHGVMVHVFIKTVGYIISAEHVAWKPYLTVKASKVVSWPSIKA